MPFLRLTRDRRGFENTFLMHADRPGDRPRLLYWYRTAPGIVLGRPALDEDAIRAIEEQHPDIDFDWPAILALSEVMTPEEEEAPVKQKSASARKKSRELRRDDRAEQSSGAVERNDRVDSVEKAEAAAITEPEGIDRSADKPVVAAEPQVGGLLVELVGREIATRLRARYAEIQTRIHEQQVDVAVRDGWLKRAETINPDLWLTPESILEGVRSADATFAQLQSELVSP